MSRIKGVRAKLHINDVAQPHFYKPKSVSYALRQKVEQESDRLEEAGVIVPHSTRTAWAARIVPVVKDNGSVRIWGDYKFTANTAIYEDRIQLITQIFSQPSSEVRGFPSWTVPCLTAATSG